MSTVRVVPGDIEFGVHADETVFDAAFREGWMWPTTCYGQAQCTRCHMKVVSGAAGLPAPGPLELPILQRLHRVSYRNDLDVVLRLACQVRPTRDLTVELKRAPVRREGDT
jgi:2Fe-2S ferredoxin